MAAALIAVLDVGKTNAKIALVDPALGQEIWSARRANAVIQGAATRELDLVAIESWLLESLREAPQRERVAAIVPIAHGAAAVLVDHAGEVLAAPDYEDTCFDQVAGEYGALRDPYAMTFSPNLPQGLNLGRQLFYLQQRHAELFQRVAHILPYPQYWSWRLSGVMASEVTSLGTHTDLWRPHEQAYSALARKQGWARLMPSMHRATDRLGTVRESVASATGLPADCTVACGIHDSNASYLRFLMDREREAFTVVSSGTWTIVMANRGDLRRLREERDMLANVNVFGAPIATARYMGGREYETIAQGAGEPSVDALIEVLTRGQHCAAFVRERRTLLRQARQAGSCRRSGRLAARGTGDTLFGADDRAADRIAGHGGRDLRGRPAGAQPAVREFVRRLRAGGDRTHLSRRRRHARGRAPGRPAIAAARRAAQCDAAAHSRTAGIPGELASSTRGTSMRALLIAVVCLWWAGAHAAPAAEPRHIAIPSSTPTIPIRT